MNKKFLLSLSLSFMLFIPSVYADAWDDLSDVDKAWDGQKTITNKDFDQVIEALQEKTKQKEEKQKKKKFKKITGGGESLHKDFNADKSIPELKSLKKEDSVLLNLPVTLLLDGKYLERGFYNVSARRGENKEIFIDFYQSQFLKGTVQATETDGDYGEKDIDFAKILEFNDSFAKLIFGSIDFNAYVYIPYLEN